MPKNTIDKTREQRITMEIVVDAYDETERAMGWYYYLEEKLTFPFTARCIAKRSISPLKTGDEVEVIGMPGEEECEHEMFVTIRWKKEGLAIPLSQLKSISNDDPKRYKPSKTGTTGSGKGIGFRKECPEKILVPELAL